MEEDDFMLTTFNNPFNPFDDFENWHKFDLFFGFDCCGILAKEANTSEIASDDVNVKDELDAMDRIVSQYPMIFKKVSRKDYELKT